MPFDLKLEIQLLFLSFNFDEKAFGGMRHATGVIFLNKLCIKFLKLSSLSVAFLISNRFKFFCNFTHDIMLWFVTNARFSPPTN